jgi:hypothetical protein
VNRKLRRQRLDAASLEVHDRARAELRAFWDSEPALLAELLEARRNALHDPTLELQPMPIFPGYEGLVCGARTRDGEPCMSRVLWPPSYRCKFHGGLSCGPNKASAQAHVARARESAANVEALEETKP